MKRIKCTAKQRIEQWNALLQTTRSNPIPDSGTNTKKSTSINNISNQRDQEKEEDPFNCQELIIPEEKDLVKRSLKRHVQEWEDLDSRVVLKDRVIKGAKSGDGHHNRRKHNRKDHRNDVNDNEYANDAADDDDDDDDDDDEISIVNAPDAGDYAGPNFGSHANRIHLPDFFDYTSKGDPPNHPCTTSQNQSTGDSSSNNNRRKVVSLEDPTQTLDYEQELWKVFQRVPLEADIVQPVVDGAVNKHMLALNQEIEEGYKEYTRLDGHSLSRLRKKDRHHWPRSRSRSRSMCRETEIDCATIKIELWKRQVKRFGSDPNKCELEFLSTQTLQDVHDAIVELSEDDLFAKGMKRKERASVSANGDTNDLSENTSIIATATATASDTVDQDATQNHSQDKSSGYFFIEDNFYSTGEVDHVTPIISWLNRDLNSRKTVKFKKCRKKYLKINPDVGVNLHQTQKRMQDIQLGDINMRLGTRYTHVFNGDCETTVFFTDITMRTKDEDDTIPKSSYPLLHDVWTLATASLVHGVGVCDACDHCPAVVVTIEDELSDGGPTAFCALCYEKLHYEMDEDGNSRLRCNNFKVVPMTILQNLRGLSTWHDYKDALF